MGENSNDNRIEVSEKVDDSRAQEKLALDKARHPKQEVVNVYVNYSMWL